ncbi:hypothetical protein Hypma_002338 [Hypsizygus marmoreus]|uniref:Uncharacterized protein n=1 Tax=Hypsizygus marmoreus TaxID=39966 RepID=A0A369J8R2_HYPMA|nr:hypothetical protein Hypma_002338 [Hypsizygus marmoreus]
MDRSPANLLPSRASSILELLGAARHPQFNDLAAQCGLIGSVEIPSLCESSVSLSRNLRILTFMALLVLFMSSLRDFRRLPSDLAAPVHTMRPYWMSFRCSHPRTI